jgi:hypothetical protein
MEKKKTTPPDGFHIFTDIFLERFDSGENRKEIANTSHEDLRTFM